MESNLPPLSSDRRKIIIDTDAGVDDAQAILLALSDRNVNVIAITCVGGNTSLDNVTLNTLRILTIANRLDIPVYPGCKAPMIGNQKYSPPYHGEDGLGDCAAELLPTVDMTLIKQEYAAMAIIRLAEQFKDEITLICLAPLTNIAIAIKLNLDVTKNVKAVYIMGGNHAAEGNETAAAEFNFHHDPEAASIVLSNFECPVTLIGWEACSQLSSRFESEYIETFYGQKSPQGRFIHNIHKNIMTRLHLEAAENGSEPLFVFCDEWAVAVFLDEKLVQESATWPTQVELFGTLTRGQCVTDKRWYLKSSKGKNNARHILSFNVELMKDMLLRMAQVNFSKM